MGQAGLRRLGIEPVIGMLTSQRLLAEEARRAEAVVNTANSDDPAVVEAILPALEGSGKPYIQTSGSSVIADRAGGEPSDRIFHEDTPFEPLPERAGRAAIDRLVLSYGQRGVRSCVIRPTLIYGRGMGLNPNSIQVPRMMALAKAKGRPLYIGRGLNVWSNVHLDDIVDLYLLALEKAPPGSLFYAENGEASMREVARGDRTAARQRRGRKLALGGGCPRVGNAGLCHLRLEQPREFAQGPQDARLAAA